MSVWCPDAAPRALSLVNPTKTVNIPHGRVVDRGTRTGHLRGQTGASATTRLSPSSASSVCLSLSRPWSFGRELNSQAMRCLIGRSRMTVRSESGETRPAGPLAVCGETLSENRGKEGIPFLQVYGTVSFFDSWSTFRLPFLHLAGEERGPRTSLACDLHRTKRRQRAVSCRIRQWQLMEVLPRLLAVVENVRHDNALHRQERSKT